MNRLGSTRFGQTLGQPVTILMAYDFMSFEAKQNFSFLFLKMSFSRE